MRASDLMQRDPITIRPDASFLEIQRLFVEAQIGGAPVVDASGVVLGMITSGDLLRAIDELCDDDLDPSEPAHAEGLLPRLGVITAQELASPEVIWVAPNTTLADVVRRMREERVHRVLVGVDGRLEGILTTFDLLGALSQDAA